MLQKFVVKIKLNFALFFSSSEFIFYECVYVCVCFLCICHSNAIFHFIRTSSSLSSIWNLFGVSRHTYLPIQHTYNRTWHYQVFSIKFSSFLALSSHVHREFHSLSSAFFFSSVLGVFYIYRFLFLIHRIAFFCLHIASRAHTFTHTQIPDFLCTRRLAYPDIYVLQKKT